MQYDAYRAAPVLKHHAMKMCAFLALALGDEWSASRIGCFIPWEAATDKRYDGLRATMGRVEKRKISNPSGIKH
jgi:hypothetical protein